MPTYEYACAKCGEHLERFQSFSDEPLKRHAGCGGKLSKVFGSVGIVLKGSGFYKTDSRSTGNGAKPSESKPDTKPDTKTGSTGESSSTKSDTGTAGSNGNGATPAKAKPDVKSA